MASRNSFSLFHKWYLYLFHWLGIPATLLIQFLISLHNGSYSLFLTYVAKVFKSSSCLFMALRNIGRFTPAITSIFPGSKKEKLKLEGVPPNISVKINTPSPSSTSFYSHFSLLLFLF